MNGNQHGEALCLLGEILASKGGSPYWLIVCGGAALQAQGIIQRATKDVDVFASRNEDSGIESAYPFSQTIKEAIIQVSVTLKLPLNWLNTSASLFQLNLNDYPPYFWQDLKDEEYGSHLKISYLSKKGLITLKILAALQRNEPRDTEDLITLTPIEQDAKEAIDWCLLTTVELSAARAKIHHLLKLLHHESLIKRY